MGHTSSTAPWRDLALVGTCYPHVLRGLKYVVDGRLQRSVGLQGFYRLTSESADELAVLVDGTAP
ncbi:hypothetical protein ACOZCI_32675 [Streptomyces griseoincarnatus]